MCQSHLGCSGPNYLKARTLNTQVTQHQPASVEQQTCPAEPSQIPESLVRVKWLLAMSISFDDQKFLIFNIFQMYLCFSLVLVFLVSCLRNICFLGLQIKMETHCASSHNQKKDTNKFKNKKQPELTESQTAWKSNNQGIKEETFIQTSRRGGDGQPGGEDSRQLGGWQTPRPHIHT